jgi:hypothetical protein
MKREEEVSMETNAGKKIVNNSDQNPILEWALHYYDLGFSVIPVRKDKIPLTRWERAQHERPNKDEIRKWFTQYPDANIAIVTGGISGIVVVDVEAGGNTEKLPRTVISKTGGGGYHYYYRHPRETVKNAVQICEKIDIRGDGGYVVAPPSLHESGNRYEWVIPPDGTNFAEFPDWILWKCTSEKNQKRDWQRILTSENPEGIRNMTAAQVAGKLLYHLPPDLWEISGWATLKEWNLHHNNPPLEEEELRIAWESIKKNESRKRIQTEKLIPEKRNPIDFHTLEQTINKWLLIEDKGLIKVLMATVIANKLPADPVWLFIVAPSGGTKTELIRGLSKINGVYPISDLTPQTFLSGEKYNKNASLLLRLPRNSILTYKDFTTILTMHRDKRHAILSQLREIYDGQYRKEFGTGETKEWHGKLGFIAGVTPVIDTHYTIYQVLGERFVQYRPIQPNEKDLARRAIKNCGNEKLMREEIQNAFVNFVIGIKIPVDKIDTCDELKDKIVSLSTFCVRARSGIIRDGFSTREIELIPDVELPTRLAKQLVTIASALLLIDGKFLNEHYELIYKIGIDSLPQKRRLVIETLIGANDYIETSGIAMKIGYPTNTTRRILEDLHGLRLVDREHKGQGYSDRWIISENTTELLNRINPKGGLYPKNRMDGDRERN